MLLSLPFRVINKSTQQRSNNLPPPLRSGGSALFKVYTPTPRDSFGRNRKPDVENGVQS
ncbi:Rab5-related subfamily protein 480 [Anopheles sinensis]|uniref:Rab5-related subfamily protein 480 n=1 Tax=Anopheles sinensis TaxID=74873 RepID=A0A084VDE9_ANOSI|nr:Rab5-related subfamily protein 480 [Anopheles sinensis]